MSLDILKVCSWERPEHPSHDPERDIVVYSKLKSSLSTKTKKEKAQLS